MEFPPHLRVLGSTPRPDMYFRAVYGRDLPWKPDLMPVLFGGECKLAGRCTKNTQAQLAASFNATLIIFILYYLDNRPHRRAPLPEWLFLWGIVYTEYGFIICVHFPFYSFGATPSWGFVSSIYNTRYEYLWHGNSLPSRMLALINVLCMMRHNDVVLKNLKEWTKRGGAEAALVVLSID